jgi:hypothetical protein
MVVETIEMVLDAVLNDDFASSYERRDDRHS